MTKNKRLHIYAGVILERYKPGWLTSSVGDITMIMELEKIVGENLRGRKTDEVYNILANFVEQNKPSKGSKKDAYDHAMGII